MTFLRFLSRCPSSTGRFEKKTSLMLMSFFKPGRITVRSIIHIVGGLFFSLLPAAEQQKETSVITSHLIVCQPENFLYCKVFIVVYIVVVIIRQLASREAVSTEAGSVRVGDNWKEGC